MYEKRYDTLEKGTHDQEISRDIVKNQNNKDKSHFG